MSISLQTFGADRRLVLGAAEAVRQPVYGGVWSRIRIGLQIALVSDTSNLTGTPGFYIGFCKGNTNVLAATTSDHVWGARNMGGTWTYQAGPPAYYHAGGNPDWDSYIRVGSTVTAVAGAGGNDFYCSAAPNTIRTALFFEFAKAAGTNASEIQIVQPTVAAAAGQTDLTDAQFQAGMEADAFADIINAAGLTGLATSDRTILATVNESVNGVLDHLFVYWDRSNVPLTFNIRHRKLA